MSAITRASAALAKSAQKLVSACTSMRACLWLGYVTAPLVLAGWLAVWLVGCVKLRHIYSVVVVVAVVFSGAHLPNFPGRQAKIDDSYRMIDGIECVWAGVCVIVILQYSLVLISIPRQRRAADRIRFYDQLVAVAALRQRHEQRAGEERRHRRPVSGRRPHVRCDRRRCR